MLLQRSCPICEKGLNIEDFKNLHAGQKLKLWNHQKVAIPCCSCFHILEKLTSFNLVELEHTIERGRAWTILNNLFKLGFISKDDRNTEFREFREYIQNLKNRAILRYFLS